MIAKEKPSRATVARRKNARERRDRVLAEGGRRLDLLLPVDAAKALHRLESSSGDTATTVISGLLLQAAKKAR